MAALLLAACVDGSVPQSYPIGGPPDLTIPTWGTGLSSDSPPVSIEFMSAMDWQRLKTQVERSKDWMRRACFMLAEDGRLDEVGGDPECAPTIRPLGGP